MLPVPVDADGMDVGRGLEVCADAQVVCVTPSNEFPLGALLSMQRRRHLVRWARAVGSWIVENDHDCEYRFHGSPCPAIRSLDGAEACTVYLNTFARILFPALSVGFVILPTELVDPFLAVQAVHNAPPPLLPQLVLARFMEEGHLLRHIRRMRQVHKERAAALREALQEALSTIVEVPPPAAGIHLVAHFRNGEDDRAISARAAREGVCAPPLSGFRRTPAEHGGLVLGFGGIPTSRIRDSVRKLTRAFG